MVNNWKAAEALQQWKVLFLDPSNKKMMEARKIMDDPNYKWKKGEKEKSIAKFKRIEGENINLNMLNSAVRDLIEDHEDQTDMLANIYSDWYALIAYKGKQPGELLKIQVVQLQNIFTRIWEALKPLGLKLDPPQKIEKL